MFFFPVTKAAGAYIWPLTSMLFRDYKYVGIYLYLYVTGAWGLDTNTTLCRSWGTEGFVRVDLE